MRIEIFGEEKDTEVLRLKLIKDNVYGKVYLTAVDEFGCPKSYLLSVSPEGIRRSTDVSSSLNLPLDCNGRVKLTA